MRKTARKVNYQLTKVIFLYETTVKIYSNLLFVELSVSDDDDEELEDGGVLLNSVYKDIEVSIAEMKME